MALDKFLTLSWPHSAHLGDSGIQGSGRPFSQDTPRLFPWMEPGHGVSSEGQAAWPQWDLEGMGAGWEGSKLWQLLGATVLKPKPP